MIEFIQTAIGYIILFVGGVVTVLSTLAAFLYTVWITVAFIFRKFDGLAKYVEFWDWYKCKKGLPCRHKKDHENACALVAKMHQADMGEVTGPKRGVVEDIEDLRKALLQTQHLLRVSEADNKELIMVNNMYLKAHGPIR